DVIGLPSLPPNRQDRLVPDFNISTGRVHEWRQLPAAGSRRFDLGRVLLADPRHPVRPPGPRMLLGFRQPGFEIVASRLVAGPILILLPGRRVDDAGNMAGAGQNKSNWSAKKLRAEQNRARGCNV